MSAPWASSSETSAMAEEGERATARHATMRATARRFSAVASLCSVRVLTRVSPPEELTSVRLRCNASWEYTDAVAKDLGIDLSKYLFEAPGAEAITR